MNAQYSHCSWRYFVSVSHWLGNPLQDWIKTRKEKEEEKQTEIKWNDSYSLKCSGVASL